MDNEKTPRSKTVPSEPDDFTTIYRHDYIPIEAGAQFKVRKDKKRTYTISENDEFLNISDRSPPPPPEPFEMAVEFLENTFKYKQPKLYKKYFQESLSREDVDQALLKGTVYYKDYCSHHKVPKKEEIKIEVASLDALQTTMRDHYQPPTKYGDVLSVASCPPSSLLAKNQRVVTSIAQIKLLSEYQRLIGTTGTFILDTEMYGKVTYPS